ncbi:MAG TPA: DciA family protein [Candidatus Angelobacter sp.]|nr:DciA family protein [Candidatus Angelobacter sp.]
MSRRTTTEAASAAVQRAMQACAGPAAAEHLAVAQVRVAWSEVMEAARLTRPPLWSRLTRVTGGTAHVEVSDGMLAQELALRADALVWAVNERMRGRPGATIVLLGLAVSVGRGEG